MLMAVEQSALMEPLNSMFMIKVRKKTNLKIASKQVIMQKLVVVQQFIYGVAADRER